MAYIGIDNSNPASGQAGSAVPGSALSNDKALRDAIIMGHVPGFVFAVSGGTADQPAEMWWTNSTLNLRLRAQITWGSAGGSNYQMTQIIWALSVNGGSDYTTGTGAGTIGTEVLSYDASGNLTSTTIAAGLVSWLLSYIGKLRQHAVATTGVHGLGTMSQQNATSVSITGGTIAGTINGVGDFTYEREARSVRGNINSSTAIDWNAAGCQTMTVTGSGATLTHSNLPNGKVGYVVLEVTNGGIASSLLTGCQFMGGAAPALTTSGKDIITLMCHNGSTVMIVGFAKDVR